LGLCGLDGLTVTQDDLLAWVLVSAFSLGKNTSNYGLKS